MRKNFGFTLIELLVIISVIGLLSALAMVSLDNARIKARDVKRKSDLRMIQKALEMYYDVKGYYPPSAVNGDTYCAKDPDQYDIAWSLTAETGFLALMPNDPLTPTGTCYDQCYLYRSSEVTNPAAQAKGYALITLLEKPTAEDLATQKNYYPDWNQCDPNRSWLNNGFGIYGGTWL